MTFYNYISIICGAVFLICIILMIPKFISYSAIMKRYRKVPHSKEKARFAIIIPARNESRVIGANLSSIKASDYPADKYEIFVIVEKEDDPTVKLCADMPGVHVFFRTNLENVGKGYALDECIKDIFSKDESFDAFVILDADNIVSENFLSRMSDAYMAGYDAACGNRNNKDWNASTTCAASAVTFIAINSVQNKMKSSDGLNITFSGTGFFIRAKILRELGGWPFHTLTEDYEFSTYAMCQGLKTYYVDDAIYYDEHPLKLGQSIVQRSRWVRGYFTVRKNYKADRKKILRDKTADKTKRKNAIGELPLLLLAIDIVVYILSLAAFLLFSAISHTENAPFYLGRIADALLAVYVVIVIATVFLLNIEKKNIKITKKRKLLTIFFHPVFLATYLIAVVRAMFLKNRWEVIEHTINTEVQNETKE